MLSGRIRLLPLGLHGGVRPRHAPQWRAWRLAGAWPPVGRCAGLSLAAFSPRLCPPALLRCGPPAVVDCPPFYSGFGLVCRSLRPPLTPLSARVRFPRRVAGLVRPPSGVLCCRGCAAGAAGRALLCPPAWPGAVSAGGLLPLPLAPPSARGALFSRFSRGASHVSRALPRPSSLTLFMIHGQAPLSSACSCVPSLPDRPGRFCCCPSGLCVPRPRRCCLLPFARGSSRPPSFGVAPRPGCPSRRVCRLGAPSPLRLSWAERCWRPFSRASAAFRASCPRAFSLLPFSPLQFSGVAPTFPSPCLAAPCIRLPPPLLLSRFPGYGPCCSRRAWHLCPRLLPPRASPLLTRVPLQPPPPPRWVLPRPSRWPRRALLPPFRPRVLPLCPPACGRLPFRAILPPHV